MKWEYRTVRTARLSAAGVEELNRMGADGWDVIALDADGKALLKRPLVRAADPVAFSTPAEEAVYRTLGRLTGRNRKALAALKVASEEDLAALTPARLTGIQNCGRSTVDDLLRAAGALRGAT